MPFILFPLAFVNAAIFVRQLTLSTLLIVLEVAVVARPIFPRKDAFTVHLITFEFSNVLGACGPLEHTAALFNVVNPIALVLRLVIEGDSASAIASIIFILSLEHGPRWPLENANAMSPVGPPRPIVETVILILVLLVLCLFFLVEV